MTYLKPVTTAERVDPEAPVAFEVEVLEYLDAMYGVALRMTKEQSTAEDLVHDTTSSPRWARA
jgi:DNA-directed RNA polymerase specialized sigma24 family protein